MKCPHGKTIKQTTKYGITIYGHEDGTKCDIMTNFDVSISDIDRVDIKYNNSNLENDRLTFALCRDRRVLLKIINKLSNMGVDELEAEISRMYNVGYFYRIGIHLAQAFGKPFIDNVRQLDNRLANTLGRYVKNPQYKMPSIALEKTLSDIKQSTDKKRGELEKALRSL